MFFIDYPFIYIFFCAHYYEASQQTSNFINYIH